MFFGLTRPRPRQAHPSSNCIGVTIVAPAQLDIRKRVDLILYALPNGNSTAETMGRKLVEGVGWRYDIQHIGAQTRALRARGLSQAIVVYLEADTRSWPEWRRVQGYERSNARIVAMVDQLRAAIGNPPQLAVTLTGHSGGGSFAWGFLDGQDALPAWLERIPFLDSNYSFEYRHGDMIVKWLRRNRRTRSWCRYDDRNIMLDGKKVVSDWAAPGAPHPADELPRTNTFTADTLGEFFATGRLRSSSCCIESGQPHPAHRHDRRDERLPRTFRGRRVRSGERS